MLRVKEWLKYNKSDSRQFKYFSGLKSSIKQEFVKRIVDGKYFKSGDLVYAQGLRFSAIIVSFENDFIHVTVADFEGKTTVEINSLILINPKFADNE